MNTADLYTITFYGRRANALGVGYTIQAERLLEVPNGANKQELFEIARKSLYYPGKDGIAFESVTVKEVWLKK